MTKRTLRNKYVYFFDHQKNQEIKKNKLVHISDESRHHIKNVLRHNSELDLIVSDGKGGYTEARFELDEKLIIFGEWKCAPPRKLKVSLMVVPIKKQTMEWLIQKAAELGVDSIYLIKSDHQSENRNLRHQRMNTIVENACRQAHNFFLPKIIEVKKNIHEIIHTISETTYCFWGDQAASLSITDLLWNEVYNYEEIVFINGPEGGWSEQEKKNLSDSFTCVSLSKQTLRAETAAICSLHYVMLNIL